MIEALQQELAALSRFIEVLQQEQSALTHADVDRLTNISQQKLKLAEELNALGQKRVTFLLQHGHSGDAAGMGSWLAAQPDAVAKLWQGLLKQARSAQRINQTNGKLIQTHLQHNQQALNALLNAANQAGVYGRDGQSLSALPGTTRSIGKV